MKLSSKYCFLATETKTGWRVTFYNNTHRHPLKGMKFNSIKDIRQVFNLNPKNQNNVPMIYIWLANNPKRNKYDKEVHLFEAI